ncbi:MAG: hypothetical protein M5U15_07505 [Kiritimatiellae bacterium]|nr:hypothetical protein [Kiritimatiellia bacterium]
MDLGIFQGRRGAFWVWVSVPLLLIVAATLTTGIMQRSARHELDTLRADLALLPDLEQRVQRAAAILQHATPTFAHRVERTQEATRRLDESAAENQVTIRSLKVLDEIRSEGDFSVVTFRVQAEGKLKAVALWLDQVQKPGLLLSVRAGSLSCNVPVTTGVYSVDFTIELRLRAS